MGASEREERKELVLHYGRKYRRVGTVLHRTLTDIAVPHAPRKITDGWGPFFHRGTACATDPPTAEATNSRVGTSAWRQPACDPSALHLREKESRETKHGKATCGCGYIAAFALKRLLSFPLPETVNHEPTFSLGNPGAV